MNNIINKSIKYFLIGLLSFSSMSYIPKTNSNTVNNINIAIFISVCYVIIDRIYPSIVYKN